MIPPSPLEKMITQKMTEVFLLPDGPTDPPVSTSDGWWWVYRVLLHLNWSKRTRLGHEVFNTMLSKRDPIRYRPKRIEYWLDWMTNEQLGSKRFGKKSSSNYMMLRDSNPSTVKRVLTGKHKDLAGVMLCDRRVIAFAAKIIAGHMQTLDWKFHCRLDFQKSE